MENTNNNQDKLQKWDMIIPKFEKQIKDLGDNIPCEINGVHDFSENVNCGNNCKNQ